MSLDVLIGGPAYEMVVDARHAASVAGFALWAGATRAFRRLGFAYQHGNPVDRARDDLMRRALASEMTHFVSADSDVSWGDDGHEWLGKVCDLLDRLDLPFCAIPTHQRDGNVNIILDSEYKRRLRGSLETSGELRRCWATGMGLCVFYLPWYRQNWPEPPWFRTDWRPLYVSEDVWHTTELNLRGNRPGPRYLVAFATKHERGVK